jgi:hypothetical protein
MLEEMRESREPGSFVGRAYVIPDVDGNEGKSMIFHQDYIKTVLECAFVELNLRDNLVFCHNFSIGLSELPE